MRIGDHPVPKKELNRTTALVLYAYVVGKKPELLSRV